MIYEITIQTYQKERRPHIGNPRPNPQRTNHAFLLLGSCKSKKVTTDIQRETTTTDNREVRTVYDTIYKDRVITKTLPVYSETIIEQPCDSLGNFKPVNTVIGSGGNRSSINTVNGQLVIRQYIDSTQQLSETVKRLRVERDSVISVVESLKENTLTVQEKVYVYPWWIYALIGGCIIFCALYLYKLFTPGI